MQGYPITPDNQSGTTQVAYCDGYCRVVDSSYDTPQAVCCKPEEREEYSGARDRDIEATVELRTRHLAHHHRAVFMPPANLLPRSARGMFRVRG